MRRVAARLARETARSAWAPSLPVNSVHNRTLWNRSGELSREYDPRAIANYFRWRPLEVAGRAVRVAGELGFVGLRVLTRQGSVESRAAHLRSALTRLGPAFVKLGQVLSTRTDLIPAAVCRELARLQDEMPVNVQHEVMVEHIERELGRPVSAVFDHLPPGPIACASLGLVYKARLRGGRLVAVKVQRPRLGRTLALDALLLRGVAGWATRRFKLRTDLVAVTDELVGRIFEEADFEREARHAMRFRELFAGAESAGRGWTVIAPEVLPEYSTRTLLVLEWIDGVKMTDRSGLKEAGLDANAILEQGIRCSLHQLLEAGYMHADPHPGNLLASRSGDLVYLDFGSVIEVPHRERLALVRALVNFVNRDGAALARDLIDLDFLEPGTCRASVAAALDEAFTADADAEANGVNANAEAGASGLRTVSFGRSGRRERLNFVGAVDQVAAALTPFRFRVPPYYARMIRALASLEGTATALDPSFKVVARAYPYVLGQVLADRTVEMRRILRSLVVTPDGQIRWQRVRSLLSNASIARSAEAAAPEPGLPKWAAFLLGAPQSDGEHFDLDRTMAEVFADASDFVLSSAGESVREKLESDVVDALSGSFIGEDERSNKASEDVGATSITSALQGMAVMVARTPSAWMPVVYEVGSRAEARAAALRVATDVQKQVRERHTLLHESGGLSVMALRALSTRIRQQEEGQQRHR